MKKISLVSFVFLSGILFTQLTFAHCMAEELKQIVDKAEFGNGGARIDWYSTMFFNAKDRLRDYIRDETLGDGKKDDCKWGLLQTSEQIIKAIRNTKHSFEVDGTVKVVWKTESGRRYNINEVTMGEKNMAVYGMEQEETASKLETLVKQKKIIAMFGLISDNDISCSSLRVQGFTADGYVFKFNFKMGD